MSLKRGVFRLLKGLFDIKIARFYDRRASHSLRPPPPIQPRPPPHGPAPRQDGYAGYEINFNRFFYRSSLALPLEEIEADIRTIEQAIVRMLVEVEERGRMNEEDNSRSKFER